eukprot:TRINITY_DN3540_c0_g1_i21.p1 TRINITY_DN3540_c0_g1~~TRINITY_DN3540_c0_g1_i21.p1  ORF type:complete len:158 (+),score=13.29 TRINITY_DN3540_c0_g1_i21:3036-3509(+)
MPRLVFCTYIHKQISRQFYYNFFRMSFVVHAWCYCCRWESATLFSLVFGGLCYFGSQRFIGAVNGLLLFGIIASFAALVGVASGDLQWNSLLQANFEAVPLSIPIIALAFVYQNVVPVLCTNLEGDLSKDSNYCRDSCSSCFVSRLGCRHSRYHSKS